MRFPGMALFLLLFLYGGPAFSFPGGETAASDQRENATIITVFSREHCVHCRMELDFLRRLQRQSMAIEIRVLDVDDPDNGLLFEIFTERLKLPKVTPITVIGRKALVGFSSDRTTGLRILHHIQHEPRGVTLEMAIGFELWPEDIEESCDVRIDALCSSWLEEDSTIVLPFFGPVDPFRYSLPALAFVFGLVDGFNPCAMWVLVAFLTALAQVGSRKKMIQFAGLFILAQGIMYALILNAWYLFFDFVKADRIVTPIVGILALVGGLFFFREFFKSSESCKIVGSEKRRKTISRLGALSHLRFSFPVALAIIGVALSVNIIEFACSVGIPQAFTKILEMNAVTPFWRSSLIGLYILAYMLDDFLVFAIAIWSIEKIGLSGKYVRWSSLFGGILLISLAFVLIFVPHLLRF